MRTSTHALLAVAALTFGMGPPAVLAEDLADQGQGIGSPRLPIGSVARYRVTYFNSQTVTTALRSVSIVSITNQANVNCRVSVDWKIGFGGIACGTNIVLLPGQTSDFCTRPIPNGITVCNSTCPGAGLTNTEGNAIVGSSVSAGANLGCEKIAVSARTVYTAAISDSPISAITDAKVVRYGFGNIGD